MHSKLKNTYKKNVALERHILKWIKASTYRITVTLNKALFFTIHHHKYQIKTKI